MSTPASQRHLSRQIPSLEDVPQDASDLGGEEISFMADTALDLSGIPETASASKAGSGIG